jgi:hypothetical protein
MAGGRYRYLLPDGRLGRLVSRDKLVSGLREIAANSAQALQEIALGVADGRLLPADGQLAGQMLLKDLYNAYSALARGGWAQMDAASWGRNGQLLRGEYSHWKSFLAEIVDGKLSEAQIRARAALYVGKAYSRFWAEDRLLKLQSGAFTMEQWWDTRGPNECSDCAALAAMGRVPIGTIGTWPGAGQTRCGGACFCVLSYY